MYNTVVFPFDSEFSPIIRHEALLNNIHINAVVSPKGWGLCQKDALFADEGPIIGVTVTDRLELSDFDSLLLVESENKLDFDKGILSRIQYFAENGKAILSTRSLSDDEKSKILSICNKTNVAFIDYFDGIMEFTDPLPPEKLMELNTPVIFVCGTAQNTSKFEIQLALREQLLARGFRISQIGSRNYCGILGFHSWPFFMMDRSYSENEKIVLINHYIKYIELNENPDLIVIGVPGGIISLDKNATNEFGMTATELSQALIPDYAILCSLYEDCKEIYFHKVSEGVKNRFDFEIDVNNWGNIKADLQEFKHGGEINYLKIPYNFVTSKIKAFNLEEHFILNTFDNTSNNIDDDINQLEINYTYFERDNCFVYCENGDISISNKTFANVTPLYKEIIQCFK